MPRHQHDYRVPALILLSGTLVGCSTTYVERDLHATDANTQSQYYAASVVLNSEWTLQGTLHNLKGSQNPALLLRTEEFEPGSHDDDIQRRVEYFSYDSVQFVSPANAGTNAIDFAYDLRVAELDLSTDFSPTYPFNIDISVGLQYVSAQWRFAPSAEPGALIVDDALPAAKFGMDWDYALNRYISLYSYGALGRGVGESLATTHYGAALIVRPIPQLELSARWFTFELEHSEYSSELKLTHHGQALGVTLNF